MTLASPSDLQKNASNALRDTGLNSLHERIEVQADPGLKYGFSIFVQCLCIVLVRVYAGPFRPEQ